MSQKTKTLLKRHSWCTFLMLALTGIAVALALVLDREVVHDENLFLIFILVVLVILIETKNMIYGVISSFLLCFSFNFFLTDPKFTLRMDDVNYWISYLVFLLISLICGSMVMRIQRNAKMAEASEKRVNVLYQFSRNCLNCHNEEEIYNTAISTLKENLDDFPVALFAPSFKQYGDEFPLLEEVRESMEYALAQNCTTGKGQVIDNALEYLIFPLRSKENKFGWVVVSLGGKSLRPTQFDFVKSVVNEVTVVLERELVTKQREIATEEKEKEQFKSTLLRSLSHDLKTPLTSIQSGSLFLKENAPSLSEEERGDLLQDIYDESVNLYGFVNNLLNLSRLDHIETIVKEPELLDEILQAVKDAFKGHQGKHELLIQESEEPIFVFGNASLLVQVFVNLIDNAFKHTVEESKVEVTYRKEKNFLFVTVSDNGGGISEKKLPHLFKDIYEASAKEDRSRSSGLGLGICKAIVEAHGGKIEAYNNDIGGASFRFALPLAEEAKL